MYNFFKIKNKIKAILSCLIFVFIINNAAVVQTPYFKEKLRTYEWELFVKKVSEEIWWEPLEYLNKMCKEPFPIEKHALLSLRLIQALRWTYEFIQRAKSMPIKDKKDSPWAYDERAIQENFHKWLDQIKINLINLIKIDDFSFYDFAIVAIIELVPKDIIKMSNPEIKERQSILECFFKKNEELVYSSDLWKAAGADYVESFFPDYLSIAQPPKEIVAKIKLITEAVSTEEQEKRQYIINLLIDIGLRERGYVRVIDEESDVYIPRVINPATKVWTKLISKAYKFLDTENSLTYLKYLFQEEQFSESTDLVDLISLSIFLNELAQISKNYRETDMVDSFDQWLNELKEKLIKREKLNQSKYTLMLEVFVDIASSNPLENLTEQANKLKRDVYFALRKMSEEQGLINEEDIIAAQQFMGDPFLELGNPKKQKHDASESLATDQEKIRTASYWSLNPIDNTLVKKTPDMRKKFYLAHLWVQENKVLNLKPEQKDYWTSVRKGLFPGKAHVTAGEVERKKLGGGHSARYLSDGATIISKEAPNKWGAYNAEIQLESGLIKKSSVFPDSWDKEEIEKNIYEASLHKISPVESSLQNFKYTGTTKDGMPIVIVENDKGRIVTAYPDVDSSTYPKATPETILKKNISSYPKQVSYKKLFW